MQAIKKEEKWLLSRGFHSILRYNREHKENFIDIFDIDKTLFLSLIGVGEKTYNFLKENPILIKQMILNERYYVSNLGYLTKQQISTIKEKQKIKRERPMQDTTQENKCAECEKEVLSKCADLEMELDKLKRYNKILNECLDTNQKLTQALREDNDNLRYKNELYLEKIKKLEGEDV